MDNYQEYDLCCRISLYQPEEITIDSYDSHFLECCDEVSFTHKPRFAFYEGSNKIVELDNDQDTPEDGSIYINHLVQQIEKLYEVVTLDKHYDLLDDKMFLAISSYFEIVFHDVVNSRDDKRSLEKDYFFFITPNEWYNKDMNLIMVPLLEKAGVSDISEKRIAYITQADAQVSNYQLQNYFTTGTAPLPLTKEGPSNMVDLHISSASIKVVSTYVNLAQDSSLKLSDGDSVLSAKVESVNVSQNLNTSKDLESVKETMVRFLCKNVFELEGLLDTTDVPEDAKDYRNIAEILLDEVLITLRDVLRSGYDFDANMRIFYDEKITKKYLNETQREYMLTKSFFDTIIEKIYELTSISSAVDFISSSIANGPVIVNGSCDIERGWFQKSLKTAFFYLIKKEALSRGYDESKWYFVTDNSLGDSSTRHGSFAKMARKITLFYMGLKPIVIEQHKLSNEVGHQFFIPVNKPEECKSIVKTVVYIDVSTSSVNVLCETVDTEGLIQQRFRIDNKEKLSPEIYESADEVLTKDMQSLFIADLNRIVTAVNTQLADRDLELESTGYILCMDKSITASLQIGSRAEVLELIKKNEVVDFSKHPRKLIVVDQGEKFVWEAVQKKNSPVKNSSYFVHAHVETKSNSIYLKLHKAVHIGDGAELSIVLLDDKLISAENDSVTKLLASSLVDKNSFGHYAIDAMFITGDFGKENEAALQEEVHITKTSVVTIDSHLIEKLPSEEVKAFGHDVFLKGELRVVSSRTYFISETKEEDSVTINVDGLPKNGRAIRVLSRGEEFPKRKFDFTSEYKENVTTKYEDFTLELYRLNEPSTIKDIENQSDHLNVLQHSHEHSNFVSVTPVKPLSIKPLYYKSSIQIAIANYVANLVSEEDKNSTIDYTFAEQMTLRYF